MATKQEIIDAILTTAGNPTAGPIQEWVEAFADAIISLDAPITEKRVVKAEETR
jgi:hypothetical protein